MLTRSVVTALNRIGQFIFNNFAYPFTKYYWPLNGEANNYPNDGYWATESGAELFGKIIGSPFLVVSVLLLNIFSALGAIILTPTLLATIPIDLLTALVNKVSSTAPNIKVQVNALRKIDDSFDTKDMCQKLNIEPKQLKAFTREIEKLVTEEKSAPSPKLSLVRNIDEHEHTNKIRLTRGN